MRRDWKLVGLGVMLLAFLLFQISYLDVDFRIEIAFAVVLIILIALIIWKGMFPDSFRRTFK